MCNGAKRCHVVLSYLLCFLTSFLFFKGSVWYLDAANKLVNDKEVVLSDSCANSACIKSSIIEYESRDIVIIKEGGKLFGLKDGSIIKGILVTWQAVDNSANHQKWIRVKNPVDETKFNLINYHSELLLLADFKDYFTNGEPTLIVHFPSPLDSMFN